MGLARNVFGILDRSVAGRRGGEALRYDGEARSFDALHDRALRVAAGLAANGVKPGDRVAVLLTNSHEWPETFFGLAALGAVCVPVNVLLAPAEIAHVCGDSKSSCLIVDKVAEKHLPDLPELPALVVTVGDVDVPTGPRVVRYADLLLEAPAPVAAGPSSDDLFILYYSSGTTGLPKAAAHTHNGVLWNSFHQIPDLRLTPEDVYVCVPSLSWAAGFHDVVLALLWAGGRSVLMPTGGTAPDQIVATVEAMDATHTFLVPTLLRKLLGAPELLERLRHTTLRWVITGSEPVPRPVIEALNAELPGCQILQGYGLSEFPTVATALQADEAITHSGKAGRALSITDLAVQTLKGEIVRVGEGEVLLRSPATMREYFGRPEETAAAFADGWLHTGDIGTVDEGGYLTLTGRKKDMIISGGLNVYPKEVEEVIYRLPGVAEASVVGVPDERWGEATVAIVVPTGDAVDTDEVMRVCKEQLASYKRPRAVLVHAEPLPRTPTGKVLKRELRPWAAARHGTPAS
jgi:acyl-CoA synthetase (AMP-forming)/AMP-acid ligase II